MKISGFTFIRNYSAGYPIREAVQAVAPYVDEVVAVDMQSTDGTREVLESLGCRVIAGEWGNKAGETLAAAHALHTECRHDTILHFEADEVFDAPLLQAIVDGSLNHAAVWRLQLEQNFQRCRWYPESVHRVFQKGMAHKKGHTTVEHADPIFTVPAKYGMLWDCANIFRDQWCKRIEQQAALWNEAPNYLRSVSNHFLAKPEMALEEFLAQPHWTWESTPFAIPDILKPLVGKTLYV